MKLKKYKKRKFTSYITISLILIIISLFTSLKIIGYLSKKANQILYPLAESQTRKAVAMVINNACKDVTISDNLYTIAKDKNNKIEMINYNSFETTKLINEITSNIDYMLKKIENGELNYYGETSNGIISEIPFGIIFDSPFLNNLGPKIKIHSYFIGDIISNIETEVKPYGINNAYLEVRISLTVTARIVLPFVSEKVVISNVIPLSMNVIEGSVPQGYITSYR